MSLKTDIEMVKDELTSEEKFFEKAVVTEKFVKKYKKLIIASVVAIVLFTAGNIAYTINKQNTINSANAALSELQINSDNPATLARLESLSPTLSSVWLYSQAIVNKDIATLEKLKSSKALLIADLASYEVAQDAKDMSALETYASKQDAIYADLAKVQSAVVFMNDKKIDQAHEILSMININSPLSQVAKALMHYGAK
ncbi:hypothetical protein JHD49_08200 [Sulfurimonas sp. SAG-AH-194-C21]|nr:hypothetical protein [Sulfurimonas sp. SAG-AH-194-C21]MDF1883915.1 hypothetical protein [Sulfurimonas sp. SAG-AH-194-C21]